MVTKPKSGMVTSDILCLVSDTFLDQLVKKKSSLQSLGICAFWALAIDTYQQIQSRAGMGGWFTVLCCSMHNHGFKPPSMLVDTLYQQVHEAKMLTRGKSEDHYKQESTQARNPSFALKPRTDITRNPKQGYQWSYKRTCVLQKLKKRESSKEYQR